MTNIRFQNLPSLLNDMELLGWTIDSFHFEYNNIKTIVILKLYGKNNSPPNKWAKAQIEFIDSRNIKNSLFAYCDFFEVHFHNANNFFKFFEINPKDNNARNIFISFSEHFSKYIPNKKIISKTNIENKLMGQRAEGDNPNAIYCYDVKRSGLKKDGSPKNRRIENGNKAQLLRPDLYEKFHSDETLSFYFCDVPEREKTDEQIISAFASRK